MSHEDQPPASSAANDESSPLSTLKSLLLGPEQDSIAHLEQEVRDPERQRERVAESLPVSLQKAYLENPAELTRALDEPVVDCIRDSVKREPGFFADALYPVMGPAIRRSISQALRGLVQQINQTLEHSLTVKGLRWRLEAARSGVPFAEVILRNTLRYRVEEVFLIQSGSGLLIEHLGQQHEGARDADAVSAMLTAIRDFARDTLDRGGEKGSRLETIDAGDHTIWLIHGPSAFLACAIRGMPPAQLRVELTELVEALHRHHGTLLKAFDGDPGQTEPLRPLLEPCLRSELAEPKRRGFPWPFAVFALLLIGIVAWWGYSEWQARRDAQQLHARHAAAAGLLSSAPGIAVTRWRSVDGLLLIEGLSDPLAEPAADLLAGHGLASDEYRLSLQPFQSADRVVALRRAVQRLQPPASVELRLDDAGTLSAHGRAAAPWLERAELLATTVPGVARFDTGELLSQDVDLRQRLIDRLQPPPTVSVRVSESQAYLAGTAPLDWIRGLPEKLQGVEGLLATDTTALGPLEAERLTELLAQIERLHVYFVQGTELASGHERTLGDIAVFAAEAGQHGDTLGYPLTLQVIGRTDGTGTPEQNYLIAQRRADLVAGILQGSPARLPRIVTDTITVPAGRPEPDSALRRVEFRLLGIPQGEGKQP